MSSMTKMMRLVFLIIIYVLLQVQSNSQNNFLIDYFVFKKVPYVIGFGCHNIQEKLILTRAFSNLGIRTSLPYFGKDLQILHLIGSRYSRVGVFVNMSCFDEGELRSLLSKAADWQLYGEMHYWLIIADEVLSKAVVKLDDSAFGMSTDLAVSVSNLGGYEVFDVYNPWKEGGANLNITRLGFWTRSAGLTVTLIQSKFTRRCNLHQLAMKASFFSSKYRSKDMPLEQHLQETATRNDNYAKFGYIILLHLSEMYNFTFLWGEVKVWLANDTLGPMSRALVQKEIQFTGSAVVITDERIRLTKFVYPAWPFRSCFIFRNPQRTGIKVGEVLNPFADSTWYATLMALATIFFILALSFNQEKYEMSRNKWSNSFLTTIACMCQQSTHFNLDKISTRITFIYLMIFSSLSYNYYSAIIVSVRLKEPIFKINDSLNEFGKLHLKMASEPMMYFDLIFNLLSEWEKKVFYEDRWLKIPVSERFMYPEKAIALLQKGGFAYHTHPDVSYPIINKVLSPREICELMEVHPLVPAYAGLCVSYNSTFFELAKIGLLRMTEVGIRYRQIQRWTSRRPQCLEDTLSVSSIDIYEFFPHLILLFIGMMMAAVIFTLELTLINIATNEKGARSRAME